MEFSLLSDADIEQELGERFRALRLRRDMTQEQLAEAAGVSLNTVKSLEKGRAKVSTLIAVLRVLGELEQLASLLDEPQISPLDLAKRQGQVRERASGKYQPDHDESPDW